jgi:hypothetical protein
LSCHDGDLNSGFSATFFEKTSFEGVLRRGFGLLNDEGCEERSGSSSEVYGRMRLALFRALAWDAVATTL